MGKRSNKIDSNQETSILIKTIQSIRRYNGDDFIKSKRFFETLKLKNAFEEEMPHVEYGLESIIKEGLINDILTWKGIDEEEYTKKSRKLAYSIIKRYPIPFDMVIYVVDVLCVGLRIIDCDSNRTIWNTSKVTTNNSKCDKVSNSSSISKHKKEYVSHLLRILLFCSSIATIVFLSFLCFGWLDYQQNLTKWMVLTIVCGILSMGCFIMILISDNESDYYNVFCSVVSQSFYVCCFSAIVLPIILYEGWIYDWNNLTKLLSLTISSVVLLLIDIVILKENGIVLPKNFDVEVCCAIVFLVGIVVIIVFLFVAYVGWIYDWNNITRWLLQALGGAILAIIGWVIGETSA